MIEPIDSIPRKMHVPSYPQKFLTLLGSLLKVILTSLQLSETLINNHLPLVDHIYILTEFKIDLQHLSIYPYLNSVLPFQ